MKGGDTVKTDYQSLSPELTERILSDREKGYKNPYAAGDDDCVRRDMGHDRSNLWRPSYVRDIEKILHLPYYNRYADKTQVFSFYMNDDITRRALHVQLVSRIARNIGSLLGLNLDLIEAISLGHDIGHTPFGHAGEQYLSDLLHRHTGAYFNHNVQSVRVLDDVFLRNVSLQTLDGFLSHNGEFEKQCYKPTGNRDFSVFDASMKRCYAEKDGGKFLIPATMEGCVMRISDIIAYLGKDRQDAVIAGIVPPDYQFRSEFIGSHNAAIINNLTVDIVTNSYGKDCIEMSEEAFSDLKTAKEENYRVIYHNEKIKKTYDEKIQPMFEELYEKLRADLLAGDESSPVFTHHIAYVNKNRAHYRAPGDYALEQPDFIVSDYIASMTDDYFLELYRHLFPNSNREIRFRSYFD